MIKQKLINGRVGVGGGAKTRAGHKTIHFVAMTSLYIFSHLLHMHMLTHSHTHRIGALQTSGVQCDQSSRCIGCCTYPVDGYTASTLNKYKRKARLSTDDALFIRCSK